MILCNVFSSSLPPSLSFSFSPSVSLSHLLSVSVSLCVSLSVCLFLSLTHSLSISPFLFLSLLSSLSPSLQDIKFFSVPLHTPVILSEASDCGTTLVRFLCAEAHGAHESQQLKTHCPPWITDIVCQVRVRGCGLAGEPKNH